MNRYGYGTRLMSLILAMIMVFSMIPALQRNASAAVTSSGNSLDTKNKITMPIKIMDYESDGMLFEYIWGGGQTHASYVPESIYWTDFTGTLSGLRGSQYKVGSYTYFGSGMETVSLPKHTGDNGGYWDGEKWLNVTTPTFGGKRLLRVENVKANKSIPLQWQIANFAGDNGVAVSKIRYMTIVFRGFNCDKGGSPKLGVGTVLSENLTERHATGKYVDYHLNCNGRTNVCGDRYVDVAVIDLNKLTGPIDQLFLEFPMDLSKGDSPYFDLIGVYFTPNIGDAYEFGAWASSIGATTSATTGTKTNTTTKVPVKVDSYNNNALGFSFWRETTSTFGNVPSLPEWIADQGYGNGQRVVFAHHSMNFATASGTSYEAYWGLTGGNASTISITNALGFPLYQSFGDAGNSGGYAAVGLVESSLGENGAPQYKESVLNYMATYLRNRLRDCYSYSIDGWRNYSSISGAPNGELFGYNDGGQVDMDPSKSGIQGIPMDFATAICQHMGLNRTAQDYVDGKQFKSGYPGSKFGSYGETIAKKEYLEGSWLECKTYIKSWYDLAYYMLHNQWIPNSYNELQSDYNYLELYKDTNKRSSSYGNYIFDSAYTNSSGSSTITWNSNKTIGLSSGSYISRNDALDATHPFLPVNRNSEAGESVFTNVLENSNSNLNERNFHYTMACNGMFTYKTGQKFHFDGDDDVYLYINGELVLDLGGTHNNTSSTINVDDYVNWAKTVLAKPYNYSAEQVARAKKLNLTERESYTFDFYYIERKACGANLRIETNIEIFVPPLNVEKQSHQNGEQIPDNGVADNSMLVEYAFALTNDTEAYKLFNYEFTDNTIGVSLDPTNGLTVKSGYNVYDKNGGQLDATDIIAEVDGYTGNPRRPSTKKIDTLTVTFNSNDELKQFLTDLSSSKTQSSQSEGLYEGSGLWCYATLTIRGIYYQQTEKEQVENSFVNKVNAVAYNGAYKLKGEDTHSLFKFGEPCYFQWAGNKIVINSSKLYNDLKESPTYWDQDFPDYGHMTITPCDASGAYKNYEPYVSVNPGGDVFIEINYPTPGLKFFYLRIDDRCSKQKSFVVTMAVYVVDVKDTAIVLDYGLTANLSDSGSIIGSDDNINIASKPVLNTLIGITGVGGKAEYKEVDSDELADLYDDATKHNNVTTLHDELNGDTDFTGELEHAVYLKHDTPWVIEFKGKSFDSGLLLSTTKDCNTIGNYYLFVNQSSGYIGIGEVQGTSSSYAYMSYAAYVDENPKPDTNALNDGKTHTYRLVNVIDSTEGKNMIYLYVDGESRGPLTKPSKGGTYDPYATDNDFLSGKDFSFKYIGPRNSVSTNTHQQVNIKRYEYLRIWEEGLELNNYYWIDRNGTLTNANVNNRGNATNKLTEKTSNSTANRDVVLNSDGTLNKVIEGTSAKGKYYQMEHNVMLSHRNEWVIEFAYSGLDRNPTKPDESEEVLIFSSDPDGKSNEVGHEYLFFKAKEGLLCLGKKDGNGAYQNYGINLYDAIPGFNTSEIHTYRLENRLSLQGENMVYLIVDGVEIGAMNYHFVGGGDQGSTSDTCYNGNDFSFTHIGHNYGQWAIEGTIHYLEVWENTKLSGSYGWTVSNGNMVDSYAGLPDGNRVDFESNQDESGKIDAADGYFYFINNDLYFQPTDVLDNINSIKVAFAVHELSFTATPLESKTSDVCNEVQMFKNVHVVPANVVYYEDDFPAIKYDSANQSGFQVIGGGSSGLVQTPEQDTAHGSDSAYNETVQNNTGDSLHVLPVNKLGPIAHFEFTGNGFEIVARTNAYDSGILFVEVFKADAVGFDSNGNVKADADGFVLDSSGNPAMSDYFVPVVTGYDNNNDGGAEEVYAVPLISVKDIPHGKYIVVITAVPSTENGDGVTVKDTKLYLDGVRVFHTLTEDQEDEYYTDIESGVYFDEVRDFIMSGDVAAAEWADEWSTADGAQTHEMSISAGLTTWAENPIGKDTFGKPLTGQEVKSVNDYLRLGPNNEVYMDGTFTNSALVMMVKNSSDQGHTLQIAMRAMDYGVFIGAGHTYEAAKIMISYNNNGQAQWKELATIKSAAEQYYVIPYEDCPMIADYYLVALRVVPVYDDVPALVSFSSMKYKGMSFGNVNEYLSSGSGEESEDEISKDIIEVLASTSYYETNESAPGMDFENNGNIDPDAPALLPKYPTLSFEDEIRYNIYFTGENLESFSTADMGLITFNAKLINGTIDDAVDVIPGATFNGSEFMVHTNGIPAKNMSDTVYFKIYAKMADGSYLYSDVFGYSAYKYAQDCLRGNYSEDLQSLIVAMLNYGSAAQEYFGYKTNTLMNVGLSDAQQELAAAYSASMVKPLASVDAAKAQNFVMSVGSYSAVYPSVSFNGAFALNFYFKPAKAVDNGMTFYYWTEDAYNAANVLTVDNATGTCQMTQNGAEYGAVINGIAAKDMSDTYYVVGAYECDGVTYYTNVITYSLGAYCAQIAANASSDAQALAAATAVYGYYAEAYFAK